MINMNKTLLILISIFGLSACSGMAPQYQSDFDLVNKFKELDTPDLKTGNFSDVDASVNNISVRAFSMVSPYDNSYALYIKHALDEELKQSFAWNNDSNFVIEGTLLKNELDGSGISVGEADLVAEFSVSKNGVHIYNKTHTIHHEWESSFIGAIALPKAQENYVKAVQKLLKSFLLDKDLLAAIKSNK